MNPMPNLYTVELAVERLPRGKYSEVLTPYFRDIEQAEAALSTIRQQLPEAELRTYKYRSEEAMEVSHTVAGSLSALTCSALHIGLAVAAIAAKE